MSARAIAIAALGCVACGRDAPAAPRPGPEGLAVMLRASLREVATARGDRAGDAARAAVRAWRIPELAWAATVGDAYRSHWRAYAAAFDAAAPAVAAQLESLARRGAGAADVRARSEYVDEAGLSRAQARTRWATPVGRPGVIADVDGESLDVVFVWDGAAWRALIGVDDVVQAAVRARDPACVPALVAAGAPDRCTSIAWMIADAALRDDGPRLVRACATARANRCKLEAP